MTRCAAARRWCPAARSSPATRQRVRAAERGLTRALVRLRHALRGVWQAQRRRADAAAARLVHPEERGALVGDVVQGRPLRVEEHRRHPLRVLERESGLHPKTLAALVLCQSLGVTA